MKSVELYPVSKSVQLAAIGGIAGAIVMGGLAYMMPVNGQPFFVAAAMLMGLGSASTAAGWMLHLITGLIVGSIFGVVTAKIARFHLTGITRSVALGIGGGVLVWLVFFLPMMMAEMAPMIPAVQMPTMIVGSFAAHLVYGLVLGSIAGGLLVRSSSLYKCEACGASFASRAELMEHSKKHSMTRGS
jgi:uncharacterized protein DUF6789